MSVLSKRLKELRLSRKLLQSDVAAGIKVETSVYSKYERGINQPDIENLINIANYFNISIDYLVGRDNKKNLDKKELVKKTNDLEYALKNLKNYIENTK